MLGQVRSLSSLGIRCEVPSFRRHLGEIQVHRGFELLVSNRILNNIISFWYQFIPGFVVYFWIPFVRERFFSTEENCFRKSSSVSAEKLDEDQYEILLSVEAFVFEVHGPKARTWTFMCIGERGVKGLIRRLWMALWSSRRLGKLDCTFNYLWV